jgi:hypothetical protein
MNPEEEFMNWAYWAQINDTVNEESRKGPSWICGHCGWTTKVAELATLHMWSCAQVRLIGN